MRAFFEFRKDSPELREALIQRLQGLSEATGDERLAGLSPRFKPLPFEDWANSWRKSWKPYRVGRLAVVPYDWDGQPREETKP